MQLVPMEIWDTQIDGFKSADYQPSVWEPVFGKDFHVQGRVHEFQKTKLYNMYDDDL